MNEKKIDTSNGRPIFTSLERSHLPAVLVRSI